MIHTLTLNPSVDYIVELDEMIVGGLNRMKHDTKQSKRSHHSCKK